MLARTELDRLTAARPTVLGRTEDVVDASEENRILRHILTAPAESQAQASPPAHAAGRTHRLVGALTAAVLAVTCVLTFAHVRGVPPGSGRSGTSRHAQPPLHAGQAIRLAGYVFTMPAGFTTVGKLCAPEPGQAGLPVHGHNSLAAAASDGGCLEAFLAAGHAGAVPGTAQAIKVGPFQGFIVRDSGTGVTLYVTVPAAGGPHDLILVARRLSPSQLVAIARSGLPARIGRTRPCTRKCGQPA